MRTEKDFIGELSLPEDALYGIHSVRACANFPNSLPFHKEWYAAMGLVKLACYNTYQKLATAAHNRYKEGLQMTFMPTTTVQLLIKASTEVSTGAHFEHFIVPALQGGAGTSINMNINEIISNIALLNDGKTCGQYQYIDPFEHANVFQSTNDVVPTALKLATLQLLEILEKSINTTRFEFEKIESSQRNVIRQAYTQMQSAVPSTYDKLFSTYNNALSRDWWRVSKCFERIKEVNLGGGAIGTGLSVPRFFIMHAVKELQHLSGLPITRSENLSDTTANLDSFVEIHATLKAHAVNLEKIANDLRLLGSDLFINKEIHLPQQQVGSSIMPGKINPVIPEYLISVAHRIYANDVSLTNLCAQGCLDLNAYLPLIGHNLLESIKLLISANETLTNNLLKDLRIKKEQKATDSVYYTPAVTTALLPHIGYHQAGEMARLMKTDRISIFEANQQLQFLPNSLLNQLMKPEALIKQGYSLEDLHSEY